MSNELDEAVNRVRRYKSGESLESVYDFADVRLSGLARAGLAEAGLACDYKLIADAYLSHLDAEAARKADDDKPVTLAWRAESGTVPPL